MVTQARDDIAIGEFAEAIGDWLITQRFGQMTPLAFRYRLWEPRPDDRLDGELPHIVIELFVEDPHPPRSQPGMKDEEHLDLEAMQDRVEAILWPREDREAAEKATRDYAAVLDFPTGIDPHRPVTLHIFGRSEAKECGVSI